MNSFGVQRVIQDDGWTPWVETTPKGWWFLNIATWSRTRHYTVEFGTTTTTTDCIQMEIDTGPTGGPMPRPPGWPDTMVYYFWGQRSVAPSTTRWSGVTEQFWDTQTEVRWFDPPDFLPDCRVIVGPTLFRGDLLRIETRWLSKLSGREARMLLNFEEVEHNKRLDVGRLSPGHQVLDLEIGKGRNRKAYQVAFSVQNKLDIVFDDPVVDVSLRQDPKLPNGTTIKFRVRNNTPHEVPAIVTCLGVPEGWMGMLNDYRPFRLKPHKEREMTLQVEMMNDLGVVDSGLVPFSVACTPYLRDLFRGRSSPEQLSSATAYVRPKFERQFAARLRKAKQAFERGEPLVG